MDLSHDTMAILLVEDGQSSALREQLHHYQVVTVATAEDATEHLLLDDYHLVIIKENLPFMNGLTLLHHIRSTLRSQVPVLMIFEKEDLDLIHFARQAGMSDYILRSEIETTRVLTRLVDHILKRHRLESKLVEVQRRMKEVALVDPLTQVYNRSYFDESIAIEISRARARGEELSLVMVDIDDFKQVNDHYGHLMGDMVLKDIAHLIQSHLRSRDVLCRYGGDEFVILFPGTSQSETLEICHRFQEALQRHVFGDDTARLQVTVSIGLIPYSSTHESETDFLHQADQQLYFAKRSGKNCINYN